MATMHSQIQPLGAAPAAADEPAIDRKHLFRMTLGDGALEREVLALFDRQAEMLIARMHELDPSGVAALAHTLKGSARGVGAWPMARAAEAVEAAPPAELAQALASLVTVAGKTRTAIAGMLNPA